MSRLFCYYASPPSSSVYCGRSFQREAATHQHKEQRHEEDRQHGGGDHPAHHSGADRMLAAGTGAGAGRHRQHAEDERQRGHQDGAQALTASRQRGAEQILAFLVQLIGELNNQNGVLSPTGR